MSLNPEKAEHHKQDVANEMNFLIGTMYELQNPLDCMARLHSITTNEADANSHINRMRIYAVMHYVELRRNAGSINFTGEQNALLNDLMESFEEKIITDKETMDAFYEPNNWITIIQTTPVKKEKEHFVDILKHALRTRMPASERIGNCIIDVEPRLLPERPDHEAMRGNTHNIRNLFEGMLFLTPFSGIEFQARMRTLSHAKDQHAIQRALRRLNVFFTFYQAYEQDPIKKAALMSHFQTAIASLKRRLPHLATAIDDELQSFPTA